MYCVCVCVCQLNAQDSCWYLHSFVICCYKQQQKYSKQLAPVLFQPFTHIVKMCKKNLPSLWHGTPKNALWIPLTWIVRETKDFVCRRPNSNSATKILPWSSQPGMQTFEFWSFCVSEFLATINTSAIPPFSAKCFSRCLSIFPVLLKWQSSLQFIPGVHCNSGKVGVLLTCEDQTSC